MFSIPNKENILQKFPNVISVYFNNITSPIDFRGLDKIESLLF